MTFLIYKNILCNKVDTIYNKKNNSSSICNKLNLPSSQSVLSQLGFKTEQAINEFVNTQSGVTNLKFLYPQIGPHQIDVLFEYKNTVYYFESKNNMQLDTEKSLKSIEKIRSINKYLRRTYRGKRIICKFINMWEYSSDNMTYLKRTIRKKDIYGYSDFFRIFKIDVSKREFQNLIKITADKLITPDISNNDDTINKYKHMSLKRKYNLLEKKFNTMDN